MSKSNKIDQIINSLHPLEKKVALFLKKDINFEELIIKSKLKDVEVMRALQWLSNKGVLSLNKTFENIIILEKYGKQYVKTDLPEYIFLKSLTNKFEDVNKLVKKIKFDPVEVNTTIGQLKKLNFVEIQKGKNGIEIKANEAGLKNKQNPYIKLLKKIEIDQNEDSLNKDELNLIKDLLKRKQILKKEVKRTEIITISEIGFELIKKDLSKIKLEENLNSDMLKKGDWKDKTFRHYDVSLNVPKISGGKEHFVNQAIEYCKKIWTDLGFEELEGTCVDTAFWDLDSLFVPQDHPARTMQDTFYIDNPSKGTLPKDISKKVKEVHENGANTGSIGWRYNWSEKEASKLMLRTHTTILSAKKLSELKKEDLPKKYFSVNKVFRNETLDWKHLFEFFQVEGIVVDPNANFQNLLGYLKEFYKKMGYDKIRIRPAYFPYTSPSIEIEVFVKEKNSWIELGGAGIFRPEVTKTLLGFECPVLAWGQGFERIITSYFNITDLRDIYKNDLEQIKNMRTFIK
ncbi:phenylalanine--tRNA ligase subunit alpha [Candidatus Woesearchaeota archaeon]|jgi:phenylalanyl-tRNA synthetase alpha chain|nr:phenylalanine--tRNA ligase subunit alpha [Candidatus Woesearchaeota archaeon]MBT4387306.1 phenylalanine--tRNA ligase subunit alpha [Candidatus Woesearchaeota archaeon]MBT4595445.1 phenylalanine--tRNA ligase subunit alpha [Candidatus Woesearchaeota archaeon]MBT5741160.1 phenylalanine--tRNA ligase subunit alpha [Candidatus Woesearchaeota archaeon]MBT6505926.1 phenylalanine--tRNA ligase subunit alpha [Candidatus Woesearchaeota archaeon]